MAWAIGAALAASVSAAWCALLPAVGPRVGFVDRPDGGELKIHSRPAVPLAGPGLLVGVIVGLAAVGELAPTLTVGLVVVTALGVADDRWQLAPSVRISLEVLGALVIAARWWGESPAFAIGGAVVVVVAVNAVNLYDGLDGLAGTTGLVGLILISALAWMSGGAFAIPLILAAALVGFLPFNRHPARVFLGDGGAYLLGAVMAVALWDVGLGYGWWGSLAALGLIGMFGVDLVVTVLRRFRARQPLFLGDRSHIYDVMIARGLPVISVVARLAAAHLLVVALSGAAVLTLPSPLALAAVVVTGVVAVSIAWSMTASATG